LLIATDFDGTLCPIAAAPAAITVPRRTQELLRDLAAADENTVAIVTGRALADIQNRLAIDAVFAGNHGLEISGRGLRFQHPAAQSAREMLSSICASLQVSLDCWEGAWIEDKGLTATVHYRRVREQDQNTVLLAVRAHMLRFEPMFGVRGGRKSIEIYPSVGWGKGDAVQYIREQLGLESALCICLGDDETDESMFSAFADHICIRVTLDAPTRAPYYLDDCSEVSALLEHLCRWRAACFCSNPA
jgi:trehalose-phosphatase